MNFLTVLLFAILLLVSTEPEIFSHAATRPNAGMDVATDTAPSVSWASPSHGKSSVAASPVSQVPPPETLAQQAALDATTDFVQNRMDRASQHLRERFDR